MIQFTYDSCLLYINHICMSIINMQTKNIFILIDQSFAVVEKAAIHSIKIMIKTREQLISDNSLKFNDTRIERIDSNEIIYFRQKTHIQGIQLINSVESTIIISVRDKVRIKLISREQYVIQRAREAYLTFICQSEASFDLSHAVQSVKQRCRIIDDVLVRSKLRSSRIAKSTLNEFRLSRRLSIDDLLDRSFFPSNQAINTDSSLLTFIPV